MKRGFCSQCGASIGADARFCSSCGSAQADDGYEFPPVEPSPRQQAQTRQAKPKRSGAKIALMVCIGGLAAIVIVSIISANFRGSDSDSAGSTAARIAPKTQLDSAGQAAETKFLDAKVAVALRFYNAPNDIAKHQIAGAWQNGGSCSALRSASFTDWTGTISKIVYNGNLYVDIGDNVTFDATVGTASPLFKVVSALHEGDAVTVSGVFDPGTINRVLSGASPTCMAPPITDDIVDQDSGTVNNPHFNVIFSRVAPRSE